MKSNQAITRRFTVLLFGLFISQTIFSQTTVTPPPNIVFIIADDLGWMDVGYNGQQFYETPNIDRLAKEGMVMNRFYPGAANCAPSRACLLTGTYTPRHKVYLPQGVSRGGLVSKMRYKVPTKNQDTTFNTFPVNINQVDDEFISLAELLKQSGYVSARFGKWHLGDSNQGFDFSSANGEPQFYTNKNGDEARFYKDIHVAEKLTDGAIAFIENHQKSPFFLYLSHWEVHTPIVARKDRIEYFEKKNKTNPLWQEFDPVYAAEVEQVDLSVGRVLKKLEELGLEENTVVFFTSDNGGLLDRTSNLPLRAGKGTYYEGGIRVPFCVKWSGVIPPDSKTDVAVTGVDMMPTFAEISNTKLFENQTVDGRSIVPLFNNKPFDKNRNIFFHFPLYLGKGKASILPAYDGTKNYWRAVPSTTMISGDYKAIYYYEYDRMELFNIKKDIGEQLDLSLIELEIASRMREEITSWVDRVKAPVPSLINL